MRSGDEADALAAVDAPLEQVHLRAPDERRHERVHRAEVDIVGRSHLLDDAVAQDDDAVRHRHRLDLVVGDVQRRAADASMELQQLGAHLDAQQRIEVRERLIHEERDRVSDDRPTERDALALPARQLARIPRQHPLESEQLRDLGDLGRPPRPCGWPRIFSGKPRLRSTVMCG